MGNSEITFYCKQIIVNGKFLDIQFINRISEPSSDWFNEKETYYNINKNLHSNFLTMYIEFGSTYPRPRHVLNVDTTESEINPRSENQIEPRQLFCVFDIRMSQIWISNIQKANILKQYLESQGYKIEFKNIYNAEEFKQRIKAINKIRLTSSPSNLFANTSLNEELNKDVYGYGASAAVLEFKYNKSIFLAGDIMQNFQRLFSRREAFDSFLISGKDEAGVDIVFNKQNLVQKHTWKTETNDSGEYKNDEVFNYIMELLKK